ncbi:Mth938-like domain-containing protein [Rhodanobacter sp. FW102-FHT14D06]|uniref:Mth938-like domain-containing protein n=2 Tax=unclassified Rhodanobacter TaxID=2621553 RepID=A0AB74USE1_9GAMM
MDLSLEQSDGYLLVRRVDARSVTLLDRVVEHSFLLTPAGITEAWPVAAASSLGVDDVPALLALKPEVVIVGTGERQVFPAAAFTAGFLRKGIGIEVMDNAAAARTYNLLAGEDRQVVAGFILPPA